jgi:hypothetical protein
MGKVHELAGSQHPFVELGRGRPRVPGAAGDRWPACRRRAASCWPTIACRRTPLSAWQRKARRCCGAAIFTMRASCLQAMARRIDRKPRQAAEPESVIAAEDFHRYRLAQAQRARTLGMVLLPFDADFHIPLRRAPEVRDACLAAYGPVERGFRRLAARTARPDRRLRVAQEGGSGPALEARIHPHYGVFAPVRGEYVDLVAKAPLPADVPVGLRYRHRYRRAGGFAGAARRGRVVATDNDARAMPAPPRTSGAWAWPARVEVVKADLFPPGQAHLIVCNPPWLPGRAGYAARAGCV